MSCADTVWCKYPSLDTVWCNTDMKKARERVLFSVISNLLVDKILFCMENNVVLQIPCCEMRLWRVNRCAEGRFHFTFSANWFSTRHFMSFESFY